MWSKQNPKALHGFPVLKKNRDFGFEKLRVTEYAGLQTLHWWQSDEWRPATLVIWMAAQRRKIDQHRFYAIFSCAADENQTIAADFQHNFLVESNRFRINLQTTENWNEHFDSTKWINEHQFPSKLSWCSEWCWILVSVDDMQILWESNRWLRCIHRTENGIRTLRRIWRPYEQSSTAVIISALMTRFANRWFCILSCMKSALTLHEAVVCYRQQHGTGVESSNWLFFF